MSGWLTRALALTPPSDAPAKPAKPPETSPTERSEGSFAGYAGFAARGPYRFEASPAPAIDGPARWRVALLALSPDRDPCPGWRPNAWARVLGNALDFLHLNGVEARRLGWTATELFGVNPVVGVIRVDHCGALMLTVGGRVESVVAGAIRYAGGLVYWHSPVPAAAVPVGAFGREAVHPRPRPNPSSLMEARHG